MKRFHPLYSLIFLLGLAACAQPGSESSSETEATPAEVASEPESAPAAELNVDSLVQQIDQLRSSIEATASDPVEIPTAKAREKVKQKWEKIEYYTEDDQVVRIKTYPYAQVSSRTEEFYLADGQLVLAVIEDDGTGERGKSEEAIDKMYYYHEGELLKEESGSEEAEYSIRESDAEELLQEVREYLAIFREFTSVAPASNE